MKILLRALIISIFGVILLGVIAYARGYRFDPKNRSIGSTGIIAVNSFPQAAKVFVNGKFKGATSINLTLPPGKYQIDIHKDGYTSLTKNVSLKGELVLSVDALLFPINPSLSPLTNLGIVKAQQIDQTDRVVLFTDTGSIEKDGIYTFGTGKKPLSFLPPLTPLVLKSSLPAGIDFKKSKIYFSYNYEQAIFEFELPDGTLVSYLLSLNEKNQEPFDVTLSKDTLLAAWEEEKQEETLKILEALPRGIVKVASDSFDIISLSPDETKILYRAQSNAKLPLILDPPLIAANQTLEERDLKKDDLYVYDKKEDKNFKIPDSRFQIPGSILWFPDSKHFVVGEEKQIVVIDYDGTNKQNVYSGPFEQDFLGIASDGKLLVLTNLNPQSNKLPDLYSVGIR